MKCNEIEEFIILLADNEIDDLNRKRVLEHIERCKSCKLKYRDILNMKNMISFNLSDEDLSDLNLYTIDSKKKKWRHVFMKKRIIAASVAIALAISIFIPINGRSFADSIKGWFSKITITTEKTEYSVRTDSDRSHNFHEDKDEDIEVAEQLRFNSVEEAKRETSREIPIPKFIPQDYELDVIYYNYTNLHSDMNLGYLSKHKIENVDFGVFPPRDRLSIRYTYQYNTIGDKLMVHYPEGTMVKPITLKGYEGYVFFIPRSDDMDTDYKPTSVGIELLIEDETYSSISIREFILSKEPSESEIEEIEKQLIKIMESIIEN